MKRFEYTVLDIPAKGWFGGKLDLETLTQKLNELGDKGWEVVSGTDTNMYEGATRGMIIILKREKR
jgi:hypothetical protein